MLVECSSVATIAEKTRYYERHEVSGLIDCSKCPIREKVTVTMRNGGAAMQLVRAWIDQRREKWRCYLNDSSIS